MMTKFQAPTSKLQRSSKPQAPKAVQIFFGIWKLEFLWCLVLGAWCFFTPSSLAALPRSKPSATNPPPVAAIGDVLQFLDGSAVHGNLALMDATHGVRWQHPDAKNAIDFAPTNIDHILFAQSKTLSLEPACQIRFVNGDEVFANLTSLDEEKVGLHAWFGNELKLPRNAVQTITFLSKKFSMLYEGPADDGGWRYANNPLDAANRDHPGANPSNWVFRNGAFTCNNAGFLGRDFGLTNSSSIEFDLAWSSQFQMLLSVYTDAFDHLDYGVSSYMFNLTPDAAVLTRVQAGGGQNNLGSQTIPNPDKKNKRRFEIRANKEEGTIALFVDHLLVKRWKDAGGFVGRGSGVLFYVLTGNMTISLSRMKVAQWDGKLEPEGSPNVATNADAISLINHDKANGKLQSLKNGKLSFVTDDKPLDIPLDRVTQINFATKNSPAVTRQPGEVRAHFPGGGQLSFQLEKWGDKKISGRSATYGPLAFETDSVRQIEFNLDRPRLEGATAMDDEFGGLDE